jgi:hypothetical protein
MFCHYRSLADALPPLSLESSLADALLPRVSWPLPSTDTLLFGASLLLPRRMLGCWRNPWWILCHRWLFGSLSSRCFAAESVRPRSLLGGCMAAVVTWSSLADALPSLHGFVYFVGDLFFGYFCCRLSSRSWVLRILALSSFFFCFYIYSRSFTTSLVVYNICY